MNTISFPKGIRLSKPEDLLGIPNSSDLLDRVNMARIQPGYVVFCSDENTRFSYVEINIDSQNIWSLFCSLSRKLLPSEVIPIIGSIDDDSLFKGKYSTFTSLIELFEEFNFYLVNDCNIQFGFGSVSSEEVLEVFITATKHFKVWTNKINVLEEIMKEYDLPKMEKLQFIDEFPRTTINLEYDTDFYGYEELIEHLIRLVT